MDTVLAAVLGLATLLVSGAALAATPPTPLDDAAITRQEEAYWTMSRTAPSEARTLDLLRRRDFPALERELEAVQRDYEAHRVDELHVFSLFHAFDKEGAEGDIKRWITANPDSWTALAARAISRVGAGARARGGKSISDTLPLQLEQMERLLALAASDFEAVLAQQPRFMIAYARLIDIARMRGDCGKAELIAGEALRRDPATYFVRETYMALLEPKWCGTDWSAMEAFAQRAQAHVAENPHLVVLLGDPIAARAYEQVLAKDWPGALDLYTQAMRFGREPMWLRMRAMAYEKLGRCPDAIADLDEAIRLDPDRSEFRVARARCLRPPGPGAASLGN